MAPTQKPLPRGATITARAFQLRKSVANAASRIVEQTPTPRGLAVRLGRRWFAVSWAIVLFFHLFNALYTVGLAYIYLFLRTPEMESVVQGTTFTYKLFSCPRRRGRRKASRYRRATSCSVFPLSTEIKEFGTLWNYASPTRKVGKQYYVSLLQMLPQSKFVYITVLYGVISALNWENAFKMVFYSIVYRQLVFQKRTTKIADAVRSSRAKSSLSTRLCTCVPKSVSRFVKRLQRATSVRGHLFDTKLLMRELTEVASQTYQAYSSSLLVSKVWINQLFGGIVFLNCIANTAVHIFKEDEIGMRRFLCTVIDLFLDFAWGFVFPGNIIFHYLPLFVVNDYNVPVEFLSSDTLMVRGILDCRQFFMVSWTDAFTTALPYISMLTGLRNMKTLLEIGDELPAPSTQVVVNSVGSTASSIIHPISDDESTKSLPLAPPSSSSTLPGPVINLTSITRTKPKSKPWLLYRVRFMLIVPLFGLGVLFTSLTASGVFGSGGECGAGCKLRMRPWFTTQCACSVLEIDCFARQIDGTAPQMREIFATLDVRVLNSLIVSHCPALSMPADFQRFYSLNALEFYNVTFVDWPQEAALTEAAFPSLTYLFIVRSQLGAWPDGLIYETTRSLVDIEISATVLEPVPSDLDERWPAVVMLYLDFCGLQEFPVVLTRMAVTDLSLVGNNISVIPEDLPEAPSWLYFFLDRNPLQKLPDPILGIPNLQYFSVQNTNISVFPQWLYDRHAKNPDIRVNAYGTEACAAMRPEDAFIGCATLNLNTINGGFALLEKDATRVITHDAAPPEYPYFYT